MKENREKQQKPVGGAVQVGEDRACHRSGRIIQAQEGVL